MMEQPALLWKCREGKKKKGEAGMMGVVAEQHCVLGYTTQPFITLEEKIEKMLRLNNGEVLSKFSFQIDREGRGN